MDTKTNKDGLTETMRVRVPEKVKARFARLAVKKVKTLPELTREAFVSFLEKEEQLANGK